ncbi:hypothetical protein AO382_0882 [Moraxella catarrhalis]|uniref:Uncharacterized protein n=1 Tax=Moraxella catarrhalis TaxID=480 RepID=A0A7Z0UZD7_MORCA|nr:hypothetical protein AO382_0882 [Moraxella catarrhalis]
MRRIIDEFFTNARIFYKNWHNFVIFERRLRIVGCHHAKIFMTNQSKQL